MSRAKTKVPASTPNTAPASTDDPLAELFSGAPAKPLPAKAKKEEFKLEGVPVALAEQARRAGLTDQQAAAALCIALGLSLPESARLSAIPVAQLRWMKSSNISFKAFLNSLVLTMSANAKAEAMLELQRQLTNSEERRETGADIFKWVDLALRSADPSAMAGMTGRRAAAASAGMDPSMVPAQLGGSLGVVDAVNVQEAADVSGSAVKGLDPARRRKLVELLRNTQPAGEGVGAVRP